MPGSVDAVIVAAGSGLRYGRRKQFLLLGETTVVGFIADIFSRMDEIKNIIVIYPEDMAKEEFIMRAKFKQEVIVACGGSKRDESVKNGIRKVTSKYVLIHDAVRPLISQDLIKRVIAATKKYGAAVPTLNPVSTVKYKEGDSVKTLNRSKVYLIQTPQGFISKEIVEAYDKYKSMNFTDSSSLMEEGGKRIKLIKGEKYNIKITSSEDYRYIREVLKI